MKASAVAMAMLCAGPVTSADTNDTPPKQTSQNITLDFATGNFEQGDFSSFGLDPWQVIQRQGGEEGDYAVQSGNLVKRDHSVLILNAATSAGEISFDLRVQFSLRIIIGCCFMWITSSLVSGLEKKTGNRSKCRFRRASMYSSGSNIVPPWL